MSIFRSEKTQGAERPSILIQLRLLDKAGVPVDPSLAWQALLLAFKDHPHYAITKAEFSPDKGSSINAEAQTPAKL